MIKTVVCYSILLLPVLTAANEADIDSYAVKGRVFASRQTMTSIPAPIKVPAGNTAILFLHAKGEQIYQCLFNKDAYLWQLQAPDAKLFDADGKLVGSHAAGPIWDYRDGSQARGRVIAKINNPSNSSIDWLLIEIVGHKGKGILAKTSYINRINTEGGLPPSSGCEANHLGSEKHISYSADYVFYAKQAVVP
jgi:hypothetical protein